MKSNLKNDNMRFFLCFMLIFMGCAVMAQYPAIPTNKIVLGNQTTGDGLVYRGAGTPAHTPITNRNAWIYLDTNTGDMYWYNPNTLAWQLVASGGGGGDGIYGGSGEVATNAVAQVPPGTVFQIGTDLNNPTSTGETIVLYVDEAGNFGYIGVSPSILGGAALAFQDQNTGAGSAISAATTGFAMAYASAEGSGSINITDAGIQISGTGLPTIFGGNRGVVFPNLTTAQRDSIPSPAPGTVVYNTSTSKLQVRTSSAWVDLH